jgi:hypothetical protein
MVVPPCSTHPAGVLVIRHNVAVVREPFLAYGTVAVLRYDLPIQELSHFSVGSDFAVASGMLRIFDAPNAKLAQALFFGNCFPAAAKQGAVNWTKLIAAESHEIPPG